MNKFASQLAKLRRGIKEQPSERKRAACRVNLELARTRKAELHAKLPEAIPATTA